MNYGPISIANHAPKAIAFFRGTDVPIKAFFEYLEAEKSMEKFLNDYPAVNKKDALEILQMAKLALTSEKILKENFSS